MFIDTFIHRTQANQDKMCSVVELDSCESAQKDRFYTESSLITLKRDKISGQSRHTRSLGYISIKTYHMCSNLLCVCLSSAPEETKKCLQEIKGKNMLDMNADMDFNAVPGGKSSAKTRQTDVVLWQWLKVRQYLKGHENK